MTSLIETLNQFGQRFVDFALPMLIQSSLMIVVIFALDLVLRKRVRSVIRYGLWMLVLIKLILPPSFASPTGVGYWLTLKQPDKPVVVPAPVQVTVSYSEAEPIYIPSTAPLPPYTPTLTWPAILLLGWASVAFGLVIWLILRARFVARMSARANVAPESLLELLQSCCEQLKIKQPIRLKFSTEATSPAVCGLSRPTILIPAQLADKLSALPMRAVLLHELAHIKRGDLWVNYAQTLLQIAYWYNPLLWLANAVIRRVREQAVDEMVMVEMGREADAYPTTLLEVAKLTFTRSVLSLGLVGIMESKSALKERIQTLLSRPIPKVARLGWKGLACIGLLGLIALPMASHPRANAIEVNNKPSEPTIVTETSATDLDGPPTLSTTTKGHQAIINKLKSVRLDKVFYDGLPLGEVVKNLNMEAKKHDPDKRGIYFFIDNDVNATGETVNMSTMPINIDLPMINARLADVLDAIIKVVPQSISFEVGNSTVAFFAGTPAQRLHTRTFTVDTNSFITALQRLAGQPPSKNMTELLEEFRTSLEALGVSLLPPKYLSYSDGRGGFLMIRGTTNDLAIVEKAIKDLGVAPAVVKVDLSPPRIYSVQLLCQQTQTS